MKEIIKLSVALGLVGAVAATLLFVADQKTREAKAAAQLEQKSGDLKKVLPDFGNQPLTDMLAVGENNAVIFYRARATAGGPVVAAAGQAAAKGFGGPVQVLVGIQPDGQVRKVLVTKHAETPGLGTQVTDRQCKVTIFELCRQSKHTPDNPFSVPPNAYLDQFEAFAFDGTVRIELDKDKLKPVSGATISSAAVARAVAEVAACFAANRDAILN